MGSINQANPTQETSSTKVDEGAVAWFYINQQFN
jgi:hypothetical protein